MIAGRIHTAFWQRLATEIEGEIESSLFARGRYATDASAYQCFPAAVLFPKSSADLAIVVEMAREEGVPITARGGGTSTAGQSLGEGIVLDFSRHLNQLLSIDEATLTCKIQPGITPALLAAALKPSGLAFPVVIASGQQATLGGMLANNSSGLRGLRYGRMSENLKTVSALLADGQRVDFVDTFDNEHPSLGSDRLLDLLQFGELHQKEITAAWPAVKGNPPGAEGPDLRALLPGKGAHNFVKLLAGSEGTLALFSELELKLVRRPENRALGVCRFASVNAALRAVAKISELKPSSIELLDGILIHALAEVAMADAQAARLFHGNPEALLFVEFDDANPVENTRLLKVLEDLTKDSKRPFSVIEILGRKAQGALWQLRRRALNRVMAKTGAAPVFAFFEDALVPLDQLSAFAADLELLFGRFGAKAAFYGHVGQGCINIWPLVPVGRDQGRTFFSEMGGLVRKYSGALTSGYGIGFRGEVYDHHRGAVSAHLHKQLKLALDPDLLLNPGKIVNTPRMDDQALLRPVTSLSAPTCSGIALCNSLEPRFACPSYRVTKDERDSPRGRANSVRLALAGELGPGAFESPDMLDTMRLCVACKACTVTCPNSIDIPARKAQTLHAMRKTGRETRPQRLYARLPDYAKRARNWRAVLALRDVIPGAPRWTERLLGLSSDRPWPRFVGRSYRPSWSESVPLHGEVALFVDTFNQAFEPGNLRSAESVLRAAGYGVVAFEDDGVGPLCCGRTCYDMGYIDEAKAKARRFVAALDRFAQRGISVIGLEPVCVLMARDGYRELAVTAPPKENFLLFDEFISQKANTVGFDLPLKTIESDLILHVHCHERAAGLEKNAMRALALISGLTVKETPPSCCGFNAGVGLTPDTFEPSLAMAELDMFPAIRKAGQDTLIAASGFTCRKQIFDGLGRTARHPASILNLALKGDVEIVR